MDSSGSIDPLAGLPADVSPDTAGEQAAAIVKGNGLSVDVANAALAARGFAPLNTNSLEYAEAQKQGLLQDSDWLAAYSKGNPEAIAKLYQADLRIRQASGRLIDRNPGAADQQYDQMKNEVYRQLPGPNADTYATELASVASSIGMAGPNAKSLAEDHFAAIRDTANLSAEEASAWGERETAAFHAALGEDAEKKLAEASKVLSQKSGRKLDLSAIARTNGARVAINLYFQSQAVKGVK